jgi:hypothetical protein
LKHDLDHLAITLLLAKAWLGKARLGKARLGKARLGKARLGKTRIVCKFAMIIEVFHSLLSFNIQ